MSFSLQNQTNTIPKQLYGEGVNGPSNVSISVSPTGIILKGDIGTLTPITATISQAGIITDNPDGFDILSSLNMNDQDITHSGNIILESGSGNSITFSDDTVQTSAYPGGGAILSAGTTEDPQVFTGFNVFDNQYGLLISNPISTTAVQLYADGPNTAQLDVIGSIGVGNPTNGNLTKIISDSVNSNQLNIDGSLLISNALNPPKTVLLSSTTADSQLDVGGALSVGNTLYMNNYDIDSIKDAKFETGISLTDSSTNSITSVPSTNTIRLTSLNGVYINTNPDDNGDGTIYGTASKASTIAITDSSSLDNTYYPTFVSGSGEGLTLRNDSDLTYNPSTNTLSAPNFNGTVSTATNATNATNTYVQTSTDSVNHYLNFSANAVDGYASILKNPTTLTCNPATSTITATTFNGNAITATTATNATNVAVGTSGSSAAMYLTFVAMAAAGNKALLMDSGVGNDLSYIPNTNTLTARNILTNSLVGLASSDCRIATTSTGNSIVFNKL